MLSDTNQTESSSGSAKSTLGYVQDNLLRDALLVSFIAIVFIILVIAMVLLLKYCFPKMPPSIKSVLLAVKGKLMWSAVLRWTT